MAKVTVKVLDGFVDGNPTGTVFEIEESIAKSLQSLRHLKIIDKDAEEDVEKGQSEPKKTPTKKAPKKKAAPKKEPAAPKLDSKDSVKEDK